MTRPPNPERITLVGNRRAEVWAPGFYHVVCATCDGGSRRAYWTREDAARAAVRDQDRLCLICGAS